MRMSLIIIRLLVALLIIALPVRRSEAQLLFNRLTVNDGLSQHDVSCILQDSYGFIWIGTYDGLNRFDGYNVENYSSLSKNPESISGNRIICLFEDSQKRLWIGTDGEGLNYFDLRTERFNRIETPQGFRVINDLAEVASGWHVVHRSNGKRNRCWHQGFDNLVLG